MISFPRKKRLDTFFVLPLFTCIFIAPCLFQAGCIAGNLMIKHAHPDFPSDIFTILESLAAKVDIYGKNCELLIM